LGHTVLNLDAFFGKVYSIYDFRFSVSFFLFFRLKTLFRFSILVLSFPIFHIF
jgi:hypothetical protein